MSVPASIEPFVSAFYVFADACQSLDQARKILVRTEPGSFPETQAVSRLMRAHNDIAQCMPAVERALHEDGTVAFQDFTTAWCVVQGIIWGHLFQVVIVNARPPDRNQIVSAVDELLGAVDLLREFVLAMMPPSPVEDESAYITFKDVRRLTGLKSYQITRLCNEGKVRSRSTGKGRLVHAGDIARLMSDR
jgi:hypothetical protein